MRLLYLLLLLTVSCRLQRHTTTIVQANTYYENHDYRFAYIMPSGYRSADISRSYRPAEFTA